MQTSSGNRVFTKPPTPVFYQASPVPCAIPTDGRQRLKPISALPRTQQGVIGEGGTMRLDPAIKTPLEEIREGGEEA